MSDRKTILGTEVHAHAQQLIKFSKENGVGFFLCLVEPDGAVYEASNLSNQGRAIVAQAMADTADEQEFSTHGRGGQG